MSAGQRFAWRSILGVAAIVATAELTARLAYSDAVVAAQVEAAVRRANDDMALASRADPRVVFTREHHRFSAGP
ncbi:hypothetical protein ACRAWG_35970 [Methylobacterium sp. P31]